MVTIDSLRSPGGLFDVPPCALDLNMGRKCRFRSPSCDAERDLFTVVGLQYDYRGELCYRVVSDAEIIPFGRPARPIDIIFEGDDYNGKGNS